METLDFDAKPSAGSPQTACAANPSHKKYNLRTVLASAVTVIAVACGLAYVRPTPPAPGMGVAVRLHDAFGILCSGVSLGPGLVLTAGHCGGSELRVENRPVLKARRPWAGLDAQLLYVPGLDVQAAQWAPEHPRIGSYGTITGWGCSEGLNKPSVYRMRLAESDQDGGYYAGLVCHADSGAPVYDEQSRLVGIVRSLANRKYTAVTWLTPIDTLSLTRLERSSYWRLLVLERSGRPARRRSGLPAHTKTGLRDMQFGYGLPAEAAVAEAAARL